MSDRTLVSYLKPCLEKQAGFFFTKHHLTYFPGLFGLIASILPYIIAIAKPVLTATQFFHKVKLQFRTIILIKVKKGVINQLPSLTYQWHSDNVRICSDGNRLYSCRETRT
ncbi:hypothetical protein OIU77_005109 [Salix suchowensis]|uniref:Uncharacterized protein n=1 Tax=Salix suchowensis TaxID=1278906 RepID=A0ABQ9APV5_9ROSI|nr:hypothetical protein OIU77_005109 [Salix suchowensis]